MCWQYWASCWKVPTLAFLQPKPSQNQELDETFPYGCESLSSWVSVIPTQLQTTAQSWSHCSHANTRFGFALSELLYLLWHTVFIVFSKGTGHLRLGVSSVIGPATPITVMNYPWWPTLVVTKSHLMSPAVSYLTWRHTDKPCLHLLSVHQNPSLPDASYHRV